MIKKSVYLLLILLMSACTHVDYMLQKPVELDKTQVDSQLKVIIRDDDVKREKIYPDAYLYIFVDDYLVAKDYRNLTKKDRYLDRYFCSFSKSVYIKQGKHRVKIKYETFRDGKPIVLYFEKDLILKPETIMTVSYNKGFKIKKTDR